MDSQSPTKSQLNRQSPTSKPPRYGYDRQNSRSTHRRSSPAPAPEILQAQDSQDSTEVPAQDQAQAQASLSLEGLNLQTPQVAQDWPTILEGLNVRTPPAIGRSYASVVSGSPSTRYGSVGSYASVVSGSPSTPTSTPVATSHPRPVATSSYNPAVGKMKQRIGKECVLYCSFSYFSPRIGSNEIREFFNSLIGRGAVTDVFLQGRDVGSSIDRCVEAFVTFREAQMVDFVMGDEPVVELMICKTEVHAKRFRV
ncbi:hypothetical protein ACFX14_008504 [Malus domestica]